MRLLWLVVLVQAKFTLDHFKKYSRNGEISAADFAKGCRASALEFVVFTQGDELTMLTIERVAYEFLQTQNFKRKHSIPIKKVEEWLKSGRLRRFVVKQTQSSQAWEERFSLLGVVHAVQDYAQFVFETLTSGLNLSGDSQDL